MGESSIRLFRLAAEIACGRPMDQQGGLTAASRELSASPGYESCCDSTFRTHALQLRSPAALERNAPPVDFQGFRVTEPCGKLHNSPRISPAATDSRGAAGDLMVLATVLVPGSFGGAAIRSGGGFDGWRRGGHQRGLPECRVYSDLDAAVTEFYESRAAMRHAEGSAIAGRPEGTEPGGLQLIESVYEFLQAELPSDINRIVEDRPEVLSDAADQIIAELLTAARAAGVFLTDRCLAERRDLLKHWRNLKRESPQEEEAVASPEGGPGPVDSPASSELGEFLQCSDWTELRLMLEASPQLFE